MMHLIAAPLLMPAICAALCLLVRRRRKALATAISLTSCLALVAFAILLTVRAGAGAIDVYALGGWPAPFGIVLVLDRLAAMMLLLTALLALIVLVHAVVTGVDRRGWHFHPLFQFQLLGINGAFLTGDLFNLFVFFEVLLIASYGLMLHGQGRERLKAGVQYVIVNLIGSTLFLFGLGLLYGVTGTLNMADMAVRLQRVPTGDAGLVAAGATLLIVVFALKAAVLPLHLWLPRTYAATSPAVAALFAIMTKVGVYAIIRVGLQIFGDAPGVQLGWLLPAALLTTVAGFVGVFAARGLREMAAFALVGSTGTLMIAVSALEPEQLAAALYYLPHTTLAAALLFLVSDVISRRRGSHGDALVPGPRFAGMGMAGAGFLLAAIALTGLPPLSGFIGKLLILDATGAHSGAVWIWATILVTTLIGVMAFARAGSILFWSSAEGETLPGKTAWREFAAPAALVMLLATLTLGAGSVTAYAEAAARQLGDGSAYGRAALDGGGG